MDFDGLAGRGKGLGGATLFFLEDRLGKGERCAFASVQGIWSEVWWGVGGTGIGAAAKGRVGVVWKGRRGLS